MIYGCGGSSGNDSSTSTPPPAPNEVQITVPDTSFAVGNSIELILHLPNQNVSDINWQQVQGDDVFIASPNSKVISVTPNTAGTYEFSVSLTIGNNSYSVNEVLEVSSNETRLNSPSGHAVIEDNSVSLRAFELGSQFEPESVRWSQTAGPTISSNDLSNAVLIFDAPPVSQDTILSFDVTANIDGQTQTDSVSVLVEAGSAIEDNAYFEDRLAKVVPYNADSPYANALQRCVYSNSLSSACTLSELPLLAQQTLNPTIDDVMDRVLVSHPWMGERFKQFLQTQDPHNDFKQLLRATTAVVISYDIRPSFYWAATGAIYLDAESFWLTPQERDTINESPDYRSAFGNDLQFSIPWRYVINNDYAFGYYPVRVRQNRPIESLIYPLGFLLYHELAHANDFFPPTSWSNLDSDDRVLDAAVEKRNPVSDSLASLYPLNSQALKDLAQVRFAGADSSAAQQALLPDDVTPMFEPDGSVHFYGHFTDREDFAMMFEELMMQQRYGVYRDVAVTNNPNHANDNSNSYIVAWGQRGRLAQPQITERLRFTTRAILPDFDVDTAIGNLPDTQYLIRDLTWQENVDLGTTNLAKLLSKQSASSETGNVRHVEQHSDTGYQFYHKPLPKK